MTSVGSPKAPAPASSRLRRTDGFALPLVIFVVTCVTLMLATVSVRVQIDRRIGESSADIVDALTAAQSGLQNYLAAVNFDSCYRAMRPADDETAESSTVNELRPSHPKHREVPPCPIACAPHLGIADAKTDGADSFGIIGMRERVREWGGAVAIGGDQQRGTTVRVNIPLQSVAERGGG